MVPRPSRHLRSEIRFGGGGIARCFAVVVEADAAFGAGLLVGAAAALMLAPKSGAELRDELANKMNRVKDRVQKEMEQHQTPLGRPTI